MKEADLLAKVSALELDIQRRVLSRAGQGSPGQAGAGRGRAGQGQGPGRGQGPAGGKLGWGIMYMAANGCASRWVTIKAKARRGAFKRTRPCSMADSAAMTTAFKRSSYSPVALASARAAPG